MSVVISVSVEESSQRGTAPLSATGRPKLKPPKIRNLPQQKAKQLCYNGLYQHLDQQIKDVVEKANPINEDTMVAKEKEKTPWWQKKRREHQDRRQTKETTHR